MPFCEKERKRKYRGNFIKGAFHCCLFLSLVLQFSCVALEGGFFMLCSHHKRVIIVLNSRLDLLWKLLPIILAVTDTKVQIWKQIWKDYCKFNGSMGLCLHSVTLLVGGILDISRQTLFLLCFLWTSPCLGTECRTFRVLLYLLCRWVTSALRLFSLLWLINTWGSVFWVLFWSQRLSVSS